MARLFKRIRVGSGGYSRLTLAPPAIQKSQKKLPHIGFKKTVLVPSPLEKQKSETAIWSFPPKKPPPYLFKERWKTSGTGTGTVGETQKNSTVADYGGKPIQNHYKIIFIFNISHTGTAPIGTGAEVSKTVKITGSSFKKNPVPPSQRYKKNGIGTENSIGTGNGTGASLGLQ